MRLLPSLALALALAGCKLPDPGTGSPPIGAAAGSGISVSGNSATGQSIAIDQNVVPVLAECADGGVVERRGGSWTCVSDTTFAAAGAYLTAAQASSLYLAAAAPAADSAKLGGTAASNFQTTAQADAKYLAAAGTAADSAKLGGVAAANFQTAGQADVKYLGISATAADSSKLGGTAAGNFQTTSQADAKYLGVSATAADSAARAGTSIRSGAPATVTYTPGGGSARSMTIHGIYCGATAVTTGSFSDGNGNSGYRAAKLLCETACSSTLAHMCSITEMVASAQLGVPFGASGGAWVASGYSDAQSTNTLRECSGWQSTANNGTDWAGSPGGPNAAGCNSSLPIACCK